MIKVAPNWQPNATRDDGSCLWRNCSSPTWLNSRTVTLGGLNPNPCHANATCGLVYIAMYKEDRPTCACDDGYLGNGTFCTRIRRGCTDTAALNYDRTANTNVSSCVAVRRGCTNSSAVNFSPAANVEDGSCRPVALGCRDFLAVNFDPAANRDPPAADPRACIPVLHAAHCSCASMVNMRRRAAPAVGRRSGSLTSRWRSRPSHLSRASCA